MLPGSAGRGSDEKSPLFHNTGFSIVFYCSIAALFITYLLLLQVPNALDKLITAFCLFHVKLNSPV